MPQKYPNPASDIKCTLRCTREKFRQCIGIISTRLRALLAFLPVPPKEIQVDHAQVRAKLHMATSTYSSIRRLSLIPAPQTIREALFEHTTLTVLNDIPVLGTPRECKKLPGTAIICGGSIAGLLAARICSDHFEDVLIIEPEAWLASEDGAKLLHDENGVRDSQVPSSRTRIMQYNSIHNTHSLLVMILRRLYTNIDEVIKQSGGTLRIGHLPQHYPGGARAYIDAKLESCPPKYVGSRASLEAILRQQIRRPEYNTRWLAGTVTGIQTFESDRRKIEKVTVRVDGSTGTGNQTFEAALVVDCTGTTQAGQKWLSRSGGAPVNVKRLTYYPRVRYADFIFPIPQPTTHSLELRRDDHRLRGYHRHAAPVDLMFIGYGDAQLPKHTSELIDYLKSLPEQEKQPDWVRAAVSVLCENADQALVVSQPGINCSWLRYDQAVGLPSNFVACGDAVMRLNPLFGQGISKACVGCVVLDKMLRGIPQSGIPSDFSSRFFRKQCELTKDMWTISKSFDYRSEATVPEEGESRKDGRFLYDYVEVVGKLAIEGDVDANHASFCTRNMIVPGSYMFKPKLAAKVFLRMLLQRLGGVEG